MKIRIKKIKPKVKLKPKLKLRLSRTRPRRMVYAIMEDLKDDMIYSIFTVPFTPFASETKFVTGKQIKENWRALAPEFARFIGGVKVPSGYSLLEIFPDCRWAFKPMWDLNSKPPAPSKPLAKLPPSEPKYEYNGFYVQQLINNAWVNDRFTFWKEEALTLFKSIDRDYVSRVIQVKGTKVKVIKQQEAKPRKALCKKLTLRKPASANTKSKKLKIRLRG